jgi:hypothetical protein
VKAAREGKTPGLTAEGLWAGIALLTSIAKALERFETEAAERSTRTDDAMDDMTFSVRTAPLDIVAERAAEALSDHANASAALAHQRIIRERKMAEEPRTPATSLTGYSVEAISREAALPIISEYEWLGTMGQTSIFVGLLSPTHELEGVVCFGEGPQADTRKVVGDRALCLERGACVHYAAPNAASFLISRACKLVHRLTGTAIFYAYADPEAGEYGAVYQAAGWTYLGQGLKNGKERATRTMVLPPREGPSDLTKWRSARILREPRQGRRLTLAEAHKQGWRMACRDAKRLYAINVGRDRRRWLKSIVARPYPAPRPDLKGGWQKKQAIGR